MQHLVTRDEQIQFDVLERLRADPRVSAPEIGVRVHGGVVTLDGCVSSWTSRNAAQQAAHRAPGVVAVCNEICVALPGHELRSDVEIALAVRRALTAACDASSVQITVSRGKVRLAGVVRDAAERTRALAAVSEVPGLHDMADALQIAAA